jgi:hypothetical protein
MIDKIEAVIARLTGEWRAGSRQFFVSPQEYMEMSREARRRWEETYGRKALPSEVLMFRWCPVQCVDCQI